MLDYTWFAKWLASLFSSGSGNDSDHSASSSLVSDNSRTSEELIEEYYNYLREHGLSSSIPGSSTSSGTSSTPGSITTGLEPLAGLIDPFSSIRSGNQSDVDQPLVDNFTNEETGGSGIETDYGFVDFIKGLFASQGAENKINRDFNAAEAAANREFQAREAQIQRQWYEQMSNSAYQRAVADMKKAGINPILAYAQGGAATATTGLATGSAASYGVSGGDTISGLVNSIANLVSSISSASSNKYKAALSLLKGLI